MGATSHGRASRRPMLRRCCGDDPAVLDQRLSEWAWMVKADGLRAQLHNRPAAMWSRAGNPLVSAFPGAVDATLAALPDGDAVLDCQLVVCDNTARPDFARPVRPRRLP